MKLSDELVPSGGTTILSFSHFIILNVLLSFYHNHFVIKKNIIKFHYSLFTINPANRFI